MELPLPYTQFPKPNLSKAAFIAQDARIIGDVSLDTNANIWYQVVIRGDLNPIRIGAYSNIQDGTIIHGDPGKELIIEDYVTVGHRAVLHGVRIGRGSLIGMGAVILEGVTVGSGSLIGAGAVVNKDIPDGMLATGVPAKVIKELSPERQQALIDHAIGYVHLAQLHQAQGYGMNLM